MVLAKGVQTKLGKIMNNLNSFTINIRDREARKFVEETPQFEQLIYFFNLFCSLFNIIFLFFNGKIKPISLDLLRYI